MKKTKTKVKRIKIRKTWKEFNPTERIHSDGKQGKKPKYSKRDRKKIKKEIDDLD